MGNAAGSEMGGGVITKWAPRGSNVNYTSWSSNSLPLAVAMSSFGDTQQTTTVVRGTTTHSGNVFFIWNFLANRRSDLFRSHFQVHETILGGAAIAGDGGGRGYCYGDVVGQERVEKFQPEDGEVLEEKIWEQA